MATDRSLKTSRPPGSAASSEDGSPDAVSWLLRVPHELLQMITDFLETKDLQSLSRTCQDLYRFLRDDKFWMYRIHRHFPQAIAQLYTVDLFEKPNVIAAHNEIRSPGYAHVRTDTEFDVLAVTSATHYNDGAIAKCHAKMHVSIEEFVADVEFFQFTKPEDGVAVPLMKRIYFYLIDRKRCAAVDMTVVHLGDEYLIEESDEDSLTGEIIHLYRVCWLEMTGRFEHKIMPGKYEVTWRMKGNPNGTRMWGETEFIVVPQHGRLLSYTITKDDFQNLIVEHGDRWFVVKTGQTIIYQPSIVLTAVRNWRNGYWKKDLRWDCIELTLVP